MAWRPTEYLIVGELSNTEPNRVTGFLQFAGLKDKVKLNLEGNFHRDIRGAKIRFTGDGKADDLEAARYLEGFSLTQTGKAGVITAGGPPYDYGKDCVFIEWHSTENGQVVLEPEPNRIEIIGTPIPYIESDPISRTEQRQNMAAFLGELATVVGIPVENAVSTNGVTVQVHSNETKRGHKLLTEELRKQIPPLYSQEGKGGKAIAYVKFFCGAWTWYLTEGSPQGDDYLCFGLVIGHEKELGYFSLTELETTVGPMGLPIERDLWFKPTPLEKIATEVFRDE